MVDGEGVGESVKHGVKEKKDIHKTNGSYGKEGK